MNTAQEILDLAAKLKTEFSSQTTELDWFAGILHREEVTPSGISAKDAEKFGQNKGPKIKKYSSGLVGKLIKQYMSLFNAPPYARFHPLQSKEDARVKRVETGANGAWKLATCVEDVWDDMRFDYGWAGFGVGFVCQTPSRWGDAKHTQRHGEQDDDYNERYEQMKRDNFPVLWRYVDCRDAFRSKDKLTGETDEAVECVKLTGREIKRTYPSYAAPDTMKDDHEIDCVFYANREWVYTVIGGPNPQIVREYKHGMNMNPYVFMKRPKSAPSKKGVEAHGVMFYDVDLFEILDSILSDGMFNFRRATRGRLKITTDPASPIDAEDRTKIKVSPDEDMILPPGMDANPLQADRMNETGIALFDRVYAIVTQDVLTPVLQGQLRSGTGANYNATAQFAQQQHEPEMDALRRGAKEIYKRILRSIALMGEDVPIYVSDENGVTDVNLKADEIEAFMNRFDVRMEMSIPLHEGALIEAAVILSRPEHQLMSKEQVMERYLRDEDPIGTMERIRINRLVAALESPAIAFAVQKFAKALMTIPPNLAQEISQLPPAVQKALGSAETTGAGPVTQPSNGSIQRGAANAMRAGQLPGEYDVGQGEPMAETYV